MTVSTKLYGSVGALAGVGIIVAGLGTWYVRQLGEQLDSALKVTAPKTDRIDSIRSQTWEMVATMRGAFVSRP